MRSRQRLTVMLDLNFRGRPPALPIEDGSIEDGCMQTRREKTEDAIARGDVAELLLLARRPICACVGAVDGETACACEMSSRQVRAAVSLAGLERGRLVRLKARP